ncbi:MAG: hypothetical protein M1837_004360 [Sclerophora amabilis]|nr:MAG: hypothetical protein M1837_004360 [Sclerophora amabilis]
MRIDLFEIAKKMDGCTGAGLVPEALIDIETEIETETGPVTGTPTAAEMVH